MLNKSGAGGRLCLRALPAVGRENMYYCLLAEIFPHGNNSALILFYISISQFQTGMFSFKLKCVVSALHHQCHQMELKKFCHYQNFATANIIVSGWVSKLKDHTTTELPCSVISPAYEYCRFLTVVCIKMENCDCYHELNQTHVFFSDLSAYRCHGNCLVEDEDDFVNCETPETERDLDVYRDAGLQRMV